jgi:hypothetical protein
MAYYEDEFSGQTDASGNATIELGPLTEKHMWFLGYVVVSVGGGQGCTITIETKTGFPLAAAAGLLPSAGPFSLSPNEFKLLQITGGPASSQIVGNIIGDIAAKIDDLLVRPQPTQAGQALTGNVVANWTVTGPTDLQAGVTVEGPAKFKGSDPWYDVTHPFWGADPTGVADSRAAIQNAHDAAAVAGGELFIPTGNYNAAGVQIPGQAATIGCVFFPASNVRMRGAGINSTFIKFQPGAATGRCDGFGFGFTAAGGAQNVSFFACEDMTLDGTALAGVGFGSALRFANSALATGTDIDFRRLRTLNWRDWCISWGGFAVNFQRLTVENVVGDGSKYGILWIGLTDWATVRTLYGTNIAGNVGTLEGCVFEVESGIWGDFSDIKGNLCPYQILIVSGITRARFKGVGGTLAAGGDGVQVHASHIQFTDLQFQGNGGGSTGFHVMELTASGGGASNITDLSIDGFISEGFTNDIQQSAFTGGTTLDGWTITNAHLNSATGINTNTTITGFAMSASYFRGGANRPISVQAISGTFTDCIIAPGGYPNPPAFGGGSNIEIRHCPGFNPVGAEVIAVPLTGVAVAAVQWDRTYYVTSGAGAVTMTIQGGPAVVIPAAQLAGVRVPALKSVTPTYAVAPTWVVEGE